MEKNKNNLIISSLVAILMLLIINFHILFSVLPQHVKIYRDLAMSLPYLTIVYIAISNFALQWAVIFTAVVFLDFISYIALAFIIKNKTALYGIYIATACALLIFAGLSVYAMKLPFIKANSAIRAAGLTLQDIEKK